MTVGANVIDNGNGTFTANLSSNPSNIGVVTYSFTQTYTFTGYVITPTVYNAYGSVANIPLSWSIATSEDGTNFVAHRLDINLTGKPVWDYVNSIVDPSYYTVALA